MYQIWKAGVHRRYDRVRFWRKIESKHESWYELSNVGVESNEKIAFHILLYRSVSYTVFHTACFQLFLLFFHFQNLERRNLSFRDWLFGCVLFMIRSWRILKEKKKERMKNVHINVERRHLKDRWSITFEASAVIIRWQALDGSYQPSIISCLSHVIRHWWNKSRMRGISITTDLFAREIVASLYCPMSSIVWFNFLPFKLAIILRSLKTKQLWLRLVYKIVNIEKRDRQPLLTVRFSAEWFLYRRCNQADWMNKLYKFELWSHGFLLVRALCPQRRPNKVPRVSSAVAYIWHIRCSAVPINSLRKPVPQISVLLRSNNTFTSFQMDLTFLKFPRSGYPSSFFYLFCIVNIYYPKQSGTTANIFTQFIIPLH